VLVSLSSPPSAYANGDVANNPSASMNGGQYTPIKYYCMSCGKEHREIACPNCGSKMKRIG
jgi:hypothetical protein